MKERKRKRKKKENKKDRKEKKNTFDNNLSHKITSKKREVKRKQTNKTESHNSATVPYSELDKPDDMETSFLKLTKGRVSDLKISAIKCLPSKKTRRKKQKKKQSATLSLPYHMQTLTSHNRNPQNLLEQRPHGNKQRTKHQMVLSIHERLALS